MGTSKRKITYDQAKDLIQHLPENLRISAQESLRKAKDQPHYPYKLFRKVSKSPNYFKKLPENVQEDLVSILKSIESASIVSLCCNCGAVIALHKVPENEDELKFSAALSFMAFSEGLNCPSCKKIKISFSRSSALLSGLPLRRIIAK